MAFPRHSCPEGHLWTLLCGDICQARAPPPGAMLPRSRPQPRPRRVPAGPALHSSGHQARDDGKERLPRAPASLHSARTTVSLRGTQSQQPLKGYRELGQKRTGPLEMHATAVPADLEGHAGSAQCPRPCYTLGLLPPSLTGSIAGCTPFPRMTWFISLASAPTLTCPDSRPRLPVLPAQKGDTCRPSRPSSPRQKACTHEFQL